MTIKISENKRFKILRSEGYNFNFDKETGFFQRWGKTEDDDPDFGCPEIADIEISEVCHGVSDRLCRFCYKSNKPAGKNMTIETFRQVLANLPSSVTQIAFGIGDIDGNPDLIEIIKETKNAGIIPNITINGDRLTDEMATFFAENLGAIAVSVYDKDVTYNAVQKLTDLGMTQVNMHFMISEETIDKAFSVISDIQTDPRLEKLNAIVFLSLKQKGRGVRFNQLSQQKFDHLIQELLLKDIKFGFDSCSAFKFLKAVQDHEDFEKFEQMSEPCESTLFSMYINVDGKFFPCSFMENQGDWEEGIDCTSKDLKFFEDVWLNEKVSKTREQIQKCRGECKNCHFFEV